MRFSLAIASSILLAQLAIAAPATSDAKSNMAIDLKDFQGSQVTPLAFQDTFETFHWKKDGEDNTVVDRVFSFDLTEPAELQVTDFLQGGDVYEIMDNGEAVGLTSDAANEDIFAASPEQALKNEGFSKANIPLAAGKHEITISVAGSSSDNGSGAVRLVQNVQALYKGASGDWDEGKHHHDYEGEHEEDWEEEEDEDDEDWEWDDDEDEVTKYLYVYYTETQTETVSIHAHNHEDDRRDHDRDHERDRAHPRILINEPTVASVSMAAPMVA
ncbi:hypothetical protein BY458DRAFT_240671 [Sporodiniella umbellata]|nr:hypothetical protein BY458DRAFT_240671 [Sporodiniella umbellata]